MLVILSQCQGTDDYCSDSQLTPSRDMALLQSRKTRRLATELVAGVTSETKCPEECNHPNCFIGSKWNGGLDLESGSCHFYCSGKTDAVPYRYCGHGPDYLEGDFVDCTSCAEDKGDSPFSLHDIVGKNGVLVLNLNRSADRFSATWFELNKVHIKPTRFVATDSSETSWHELEKGCRSPSEASRGMCKEEGKAGAERGGCESKAEQAIALSHKRALQKAMRRSHNWTAIFEDDVAPLSMDTNTWGDGLRKAWSTLPPEAKIVRLGWCQATPETVKVTPIGGHNASEPFMAYHAPSGGCTHAYLVHKDVIPELLGLFPCCCAIDCCWELDFFDKPDSSGKWRSETVLINLDVEGSGKKNLDRLGQTGWFGIATQDRSDFNSTNQHD